MSVKFKSLVLLSIFAATAFASVPAAESAAKKRKARATNVAPAVAPAGDGAVSRGGLPLWVQYDQGGMYYYTKNELEKAKQYWLTSLRMAEQIVPIEKAKGLSVGTEQYCCNLISHLAMFVSDTKLNPKGVAYATQGFNALPGAGSSAYADKRRYAYDAMAANLKMIREDARWFERIMVFAERTVGKDNSCLTSMKGTRAQIQISETNCKYTMSTLEKELNISQSAIDNRPTNRSATTNPNGLAPNGEYVPPGQNP
jgi:hypothetical protein